MASGNAGDAEPAATYVQRVADYFTANGWQIDETQVSETAYVLGGSKTVDGEQKRSVTIVVAGADERLRDDHLTYLEKAASKYEADMLYAHARGGVSERQLRLCAEKGVTLVPERAVRSDPDPTAPPQRPTQSRQPAPVNEQASSTETTEKSTVSRRTILAGGMTGAAALGGWYLFVGSDDDSPSDDTTGNGQSEEYENSPTGVVRASFDAYSSGDRQHFEELTHSDVATSEMPSSEVSYTEVNAEVVEENAPPESLRDRVAGEITNQDSDNVVQVAKEADRTAVVEATATYSDGEGTTGEMTATYLVATDEGQWRVVTALDWSVS